MGIKIMSSHMTGAGQQSNVQPTLRRHNSWFGRTLNQVNTKLGDLGKPIGSMNVDELLNNVLTAEARNSSTSNPTNNSPAATLQRQASLSLVKRFRGRTVDEVWRDIERGCRVKSEEGMSSGERQLTLGETTLEDFLVKAGMFVSESSLGHARSLDSTLMNYQNVSPQVKLSPSNSIDELSDTSLPGQKRSSGDVEKAVERRLRRKIKNRESAARSRARKQARVKFVLLCLARQWCDQIHLYLLGFVFMVDFVCRLIIMSW